MLIFMLSAVAGTAVASPCAPPVLSRPPATTQAVHLARAEMTRSWADPERDRGRFLKPDVLVMPEFQPTLRGGKAVLAYDQFLRRSYGPIRMTAEVAEVMDLGGTLVESGAFALDRNGIRQGKYMAIWERDRLGQVRLAAEATGYVQPVADPSSDLAPLATNGVETSDQGTPELQALNRMMEAAVRRRDGEARARFFANDAVFMPFADSAKQGFPAIRRHLLEYNRGDAVVDHVRIWSEGHKQVGRYVIEYPRFEARWRMGNQGGEQKGKGIRLWWRAPDGALKLCREIGNHDEPSPPPRSKIMLHKPGQPGPAARLSDLAWLRGSWIGHMPDGPVEHVILDPAYGQMPGFVRARSARGINFYEITTFVETNGSVSCRVKHFTPELAGWEAQSAFVDRPLVGRDQDNLYFDGITFTRTGPDSFTVYFLPRDGDKEGETLVIPFRRAPLNAVQ